MSAILSCSQLYLILISIHCLSPFHNGSEILPHYSPGELTFRSDVVIVGQQVSETVVRVEQVWKGNWDERLIEIPNLAGFDSFGWRGVDSAVQVTNQCLIFVSTRRGNHIVANGIFRTQPDGKLLGYHQFLNPGPYCLQPESEFGALAEVNAIVGVAEEQRPVRQRESLRRLCSLFWDDKEFAKRHAELIGERTSPLAKRDEWDGSVLFFDMELKHELSHLSHLTNVGDDAVFSLIDSMLLRNKDWDYDFTEFLFSFPNPIVERSLIRVYEQSRETRILGLLGRSGLPSALQYLKSVVLHDKSHEHQYAALVATSYVYEGLIERLDDRAALSVALQIHAVIDESPEAAKNVTGTPSILSRISHEGSIKHLKELLDRERSGNQSESTIRGLQSAIESCTKLIVTKRGSFAPTGK